MMSAPLVRTSSGRIAFTVAAVPTGMKAGVRISPRFMAIMPVLAAPSVAWATKLKRVIAFERLAGCGAWANSVLWMSSARMESGSAMPKIGDFEKFAFIVGAPRSGTTTMSRLLKAHPEIASPFVKEPHFFAQHDLRSLDDRE